MIEVLIVIFELFHEGISGGDQRVWIPLAIILLFSIGVVWWML